MFSPLVVSDYCGAPPCSRTFLSCITRDLMLMYFHKKRTEYKQSIVFNVKNMVKDAKEDTKEDTDDAPCKLLLQDCLKVETNLLFNFNLFLMDCIYLQTSSVS